MGVCACRNRAKAAPTAEELRAARLRRLDDKDCFGTSPASADGTPPPQVGDEKTNAGKAATPAAPASPSEGLRRRGGEAANIPQTSPQHIAGTPSSQEEESISGRAARVIKPLVKEAEYQTIEHVLRILRSVLNQPKTRCFRSLNFESLQLQPSEQDHARVALTAVGFVDSKDQTMTLAESVDLALAREVVRKLDNTRCVWKPAEIDRRAKEDAQPGEVMNATGCSKQHALEALAAAGSDTVFAVRLVADGPKDKGGTPVQHPAYILNIASRDELMVRKIWSSQHAVLLEYSKAARTVCLSRYWVTNTKLGRILASVNAEIKEEPKLLLRMEDKHYFEELLCKVIMKAYELTDIELVRQQRSSPCGMGDQPCNVFDTICHFAFFGPERILGGGSPLPLKYLTWSLQALLELAEPTAIEMKVFELCDVAQRCGSARKQTFYGLVSYCCTLKTATNLKECSAKTPHEEALIRFEQCMEDFIDDHKAQAFASAFLAPAMYYLHFTDRKEGAKNMAIHGSNWYITLVHATLGMELPLSGHYDDHIIRHSSTVDFWPGLTPGAWQFFSKPENFGKYSADLPRLPDDVNFIENKELPAGELPKGYNPGSKAMCLGNVAVNPGHEHAEMRKGLAMYLERFAHFFRTDFFVRKAFETLNAESKPEHMGFRQAAETLYSRYRTEMLHGSGSDSLLEHVYDEYCTQLDVPRVAGFFAWLGVVKSDEQVQAEEANDYLRAGEQAEDVGAGSDGSDDLFT